MNFLAVPLGKWKQTAEPAKGEALKTFAALPTSWVSVSFSVRAARHIGGNSIISGLLASWAAVPGCVALFYLRLGFCGPTE